MANQEHYKKPLWFDVVNNGVTVSEPHIEFTLQKDFGTSLYLGPLILHKDFFSINLTSRQKLDAGGSKMAFHNQEDMVLFFDWPKELIPYGRLEITNKDGNTIWSKQLGANELKEWKEKSEQVKGQLRKQEKSEEEVENNPLLKKTYAFFRSKSDPGPELRINEYYKFCLHNNIKDSFARICTPFYALKTVGTQIEMEMETPPKATKGFVNVQNTLQGKSAKIPLKPGEVVSFFAQLKSGAIIEFKGKVPNLKIYDMALNDEKNPDQAQIVAELPAAVFLSSENLSSKDSLDPINKLWKANYKVSEKKIYLPAEAGGFFQYDLNVQFLPSEKIRPYADSRNINATYVKSETQKVLVAGKSELETWNTENLEYEKWNRSYLMTKDDSREHKAYLEIYRGHPGEASLRLTGLTATGGKPSIMAEAHVGYWFNSLVGWDNYYLSRQRWGLGAKYVNVLSAIPAISEDGTQSDVKIQSMIVDLKYRFTPGLWERDETWGALLSYENLTYGDHKVPKLGYGIFWARTMPQIFDDIFNKVSLFRYPKWVDMELIKYQSSMDANYKLGDDYAVNFHGKILWTPRFYGEAGFGMKKYYFLQKETLQGGTLNTFYGTLGLGVNF